MAGWEAVRERWPTNWKDYLTLDLGGYHAGWLRRKGWDGQEDVKSSAGLKVTADSALRQCVMMRWLPCLVRIWYPVGLPYLNQRMCDLGGAQYQQVSDCWFKKLVLRNRFIQGSGLWRVFPKKGHMLKFWSPGWLCWNFQEVKPNGRSSGHWRYALKGDCGILGPLPFLLLLGSWYKWFCSTLCSMICISCVPHWRPREIGLLILGWNFQNHKPN